MERRRHSRRPTDIRLEVTDLHSGLRLGRLVDLSEAGAMLYCESLPPQECVWECRILTGDSADLPGDIHLALDCLWTRPATDGTFGWAGFQIIDIDPEHLQRLGQLLAWLDEHREEPADSADPTLPAHD